MNSEWQELDVQWQAFSPEDKLRIIEEGLKNAVKIPPPPKSEKRVVIVGAGMAGLVAAHVLNQTECFKVVVLEATQRVGGRIRTIREPYFTDNLYGEAGAMRIPKDHKLTLTYVDRAKLTLYEFKNEDDNAWCFINGDKMRWRDYRERVGTRDCFNLKLKDNIRKTIGQRFKDDVIEPLRIDMHEIMERDKKNKDQALNDLMQQCPRDSTDSRRKYSTHRYLREVHGWSPEAINAFGLLENQQARMNNGVVALLREHLAGSFSPLEHPPEEVPDSQSEPDLYQIDGGMDLLPKSLYADLEKNIIFGARVDVLDKGYEEVAIHYSSIAGGDSITGAYAIITLPLPMLRHIELRATSGESWDSQKSSAIQELNYSESGKILFQCKERFWESGDYPIEGGRSQTDLPIRTIYYPTKPDNPNLLEKRNRSKRAVLLASYTWGRDSQRLTYLKHQERIQYAFAALSKIHDKELRDRPDMIEGAYSIMWQDDGYAGGAFALTDPYQEEYDTACRSADGRFHFAGEHTSLNYHRWIEGAVESGLRAAWEIYTTASNLSRKIKRSKSKGKN